MSQSKQPQVQPEDALRVAQNALQEVNELSTALQESTDRIAQLEQRVAALESILPDESDYHSMDRQDKARVVKEHLIRLADDNGGKAKIDYQSVKHGAFNGEPSDGHCFDLMEVVADAPGFELRNPKRENKHVRVDLAEINRENATGGLSRTKN